MIKVNATESVGPPGEVVPMICMTVTLPGAFCATAMVSTETVEPGAGGVTGLGVNAPVVPAGVELSPKVTASWNPPIDVTVTVAVPVLPGISIIVLGLVVISKPGPVVVVVAVVAVVVVVIVTVNMPVAESPAPTFV
jgi:hypothetical protein